ncbi:SphA family protein [Oceanisphaera sp.]|uniref:SphA family protein n=1 Tax=Oceanisphaera sp. TaxID=1929979 RepID=UPI003A9067B6
MSILRSPASRNNKARALTPLAAAVLLASPAALAVTGHYVPGVEGIKGSSVPPPGTYYRGYAVQYEIDQLNDDNGDALPGSNTGSVTALANRLIHITDKKFLNADYGFETIIPIQHTSLDFNIAGLDSSESGVGDIFIGPVVLGWHGQQWDAVFASGVWFDTASSSEPASPGKGYKSAMITLGGTFYPDAAKSWSFSALSRYEINFDDKDDIDRGDSWQVEWGLGKRLDNGIELGLIGYDGWQLEENEGAGPRFTPGKVEKHALGLEAGYFWPSLGFGMAAAYLNEYQVKNGPQGDMFRINMTKVF